MSRRFGRAALVALLAPALIPVPTRAQSDALVEAYEERRLQEVLTALPDSAFDAMTLEERLLHLRTEARAGAGYHAARQLGPVLTAYPDRPDVLATAALVRAATGDLDEADRLARAALALDSAQLEAWRALVVLRLHHHDAPGALAAFREARRTAPDRVGSFWDVLFAQSISELLGEAAVRADGLEARARRSETAGRPESATEQRDRASLYRLVAGLPLFEATTAADRVVLGFEKCFEGTPYRCVDVDADGAAYRVLIDSGNEYGFGVHTPALRDAIATLTGAATSVTTGSVDTALVARDLFADRVTLGGLTLHNVPTVWSPRVREPYWDANLNPFFIRDRVVTLDYVTGRMIVRTKTAFDRDLAAADGPVARVPVYDPDRPYIPAQVNGRRATAMIETGGEILSLTAQFARHAGLELRDGTKRWRDRVLDVQRTDVEVAIDGMPFFSDTVEVWPGRIIDLCSGLLYDVVLGPGSLEGRYSLTWDPFDRVVVVERGAAALGGA